MLKKLCNLNSKSKAFTLSEVLLVLSVIGVIAALTIPTLIQKVSDDQNKVTWRKTYSELSQAAQLIMNDNGGSMYQWCYDDYRCIKDKFAEKLQNVKQCGQSLGIGNCFPASPIKTLNDSTQTITSYASGLILTNGVHLAFNHNATMIYNCWGTGDINGSCGEIYADVNGFNGPNTIGKDIFRMIIYLNKTSPDSSDNCLATETGWGCSAKYLYQ